MKKKIKITDYYVTAHRHGKTQYEWCVCDEKDKRIVSGYTSYDRNDALREARIARREYVGSIK